MAERVVVVGAGIVGLAVARDLLIKGGASDVTVVEKEPRVGAHQSSHNSGVLHAGLYYAAGSLRARLCREGKELLEQFADEHGLPVARIGKTVIALDESERARFEDLVARARANGVPGIEVLGPEALREREPNVAGVRGLLSPTTASIDFGEVCLALARDVTARGGRVLCGRRVTSIREEGRQAVVHTPDGAFVGDIVVTCAGLQADRVAVRSGGAKDPRIIPFRGSWLVMRPERRDVVRGHVYPVPDPRFPFLGVHLSPRVDGEVWIGPNAVLAGGREAYDHQRSRRDLLDLARTPGLWRLARRYWRQGAVELWNDARRAAYLRSVRRYVPDLSEKDVLEQRVSGIRAQAVTPYGELVDDFIIEDRGCLLHVRNAPSPAATASLAIGRVVGDAVRHRLSRTPRHGIGG